MKIAISNIKEPWSICWIEYCERNNIDYKLVNPYSNDIIAELSDCHAFMWHFSHIKYKDVLFAKQLMSSIEASGKKIFPNNNTAWHFDDKVGQKYLLESINAPFVNSYVFYDKKSALDWVEQTTFPIVFKLRGGAGASNVKLIRNLGQARNIIGKCFNRGFSQFDRINNLKESFRRYKTGKANFYDVIKGIGRLFISTEFAKRIGNEKSYAYFQDFMPNNDFDIRVIVIKDRAFAIKRMVRDNDFRASGSEYIKYDKDEIDKRCIKIAFEVDKKLKTQSVAYDFVFDENNNPLIIEISYGYILDSYAKCPGYWSDNMNWHDGYFNPCYWQIEDLINEIRTT